ncbi:MAG: alpha/beta hydrolase [Ferruginibacter sp.]
MLKLFTVYIVLFLLSVNSGAQTVMNLYTSSIPGQLPPGKIQEHYILVEGTRRIYDVTEPTLTKYEPAEPNGASVIICPGGGYERLSIDKEGVDVANELVKKGYTAFVLKYRLPNDTLMEDKSVGPLQDVQQAIRLVRKNAAAWKLNSRKIGVLGFSAGGHLASCATVHFDYKIDKNTDSTSIRPDFAVLIYPVISFSDSLVHKGSMKHLLGNKPSADEKNFFSTELQVTAKCPPVFLVHAEDDKSVPVQNSQLFFQACKKNKIPAELYLYPKGGHGFGLNNKTSTESWLDKLFIWLAAL